MTAPKTRIDARFAALKKDKRPALVTFISAGDPDVKTSEKILNGLAAAGADIIELGMPFSDPMADGPAIQASSLRALKSRPQHAQNAGYGARFPRHGQGNADRADGLLQPDLRLRQRALSDGRKAAGVDGLIVVDVPPEADDELCIPAVKAGLNFIRLATPTTDDKRLPAVLKNTSGFVYYVSITGITGAAAPVVNDVHKEVDADQGPDPLPVVVGFGVRSGAQAKAISKGADGVVVGSALVGETREVLGSKGRSDRNHGCRGARNG